MTINQLAALPTTNHLTPPAAAADLQATANASKQSAEHDPELREAFDQFVGQTFYSQLMSAMRQTTGKPAYFHGGRAEEVFQSQLDQVITERLSAASAETFTEPMFELFNLPRS